MTIEEAFAQARQLNERRQSGGYEQAALDVVAREGLSNGAFEDSEDERPEIVEEFFTEADTGTAGHAAKTGNEEKVGLREKLNAKMAKAEA